MAVGADLYMYDVS